MDQRYGLTMKAPRHARLELGTAELLVIESMARAAVSVSASVGPYEDWGDSHWAALETLRRKVSAILIQQSRYERKGTTHAKNNKRRTPTRTD